MNYENVGLDEEIACSTSFTEWRSAFLLFNLSTFQKKKLKKAIIVVKTKTITLVIVDITKMRG
jgi:hypothetical protein